MQNWGYHVVTEVYGCHPEILGDISLIQDAMVNAAEKAGAEICNAVFQEYQAEGISGAFVTQCSHIAIHTWVDLDCAVIDIFSCNEQDNLFQVCSSVAEELGATRWDVAVRQKEPVL